MTDSWRDSKAAPSAAAHYIAAADARTAASLLLLRDTAAGFEVLMLRRAERHGDPRSGVAVFPGGVLDQRDAAAHAHCLGADDPWASKRLGVAAGGLDYLVAAVRETFEEVGLLLAEGRFDIDALEGWRRGLQAGRIGIADLCSAHGLQLDLRGVAYHSHWLTPPGVHKRFDTRFFIAMAPAGQVAEADLGEALEVMWLAPHDALDAKRGLKLLPVTQRTLQDLGRQPSAAAAIAAARDRSHVPLMMPRRAVAASGPRAVLPDERAYAEVARLDPEGRGDVACEITAGHAVRLSPRIVRITAPNPGVMTGPGTNTYLVSDVAQAAGWTVIDPGPVSEPHLQAVLDAVARLGRHIERILVTHTHRDHSPGAAALARATGAPVWGRIAAHPEGQDASFTPSHQPAHGERIALGTSTTLRVVHTPGHASNHLCYLLEEERTLFTGDHVMQGSTVVINPPDGDMAAYLEALRALLDEPLDWLAPGHGFLVAEPHAVLRALVTHRLKREAKVLAALRSLTGSSLEASSGVAPLDALLRCVYDDVPAALHPVARRSLLAHLLKLEADGAARREGDDWSAA